VPKDESAQAKFYFDELTGVLTTITGPKVSSSQRAACTSLNRQRAGGIIQVREAAQRREQIPADVWRHAFTGRLNEWEIAIVSLDRMRIWIEKGDLESRDLKIRLIN